MTATCSETYTPNAFGEVARPVPCVREVDDQGRHRGGHQGWEHMPAGVSDLGGKRTTWDAWERLWTWSAGGAQGSGRRNGCMSCNGHPLQPQTHTPDAHTLITCTQCGILHDPLGYRVDEQRSQAPTGSCSSCSLWWIRAEIYAGRMKDGRKRPIRPHDDSASFGGTKRLYTWCPGAHGAFGGTRYTVTWDDGTTAGPDDVLWDGGDIPWWLDDLFPANGRVEYAERITSSDELGTGWPTPYQWPTYTGHP